jgi:glycerophosphoryl diester phosphodiesterase
MNSLGSAVISHRGGSFLWPENSLAAFRRTLELPVEQAECDIHLSADGVPMVMHDALLDRTTDSRGPLSVRTANELAQVRLRGADGEGVPRLADLAALFRGRAMRLRVEIKPDHEKRSDPRALPAVLDVLDAAGLRDRCLIITFQGPLAREAVRAGGLAGVAWLAEPTTLRDLGLEALVAAARALGVPAVETHESAADAAYVAAMRAAGLGCGAWGANHAPAIRRMLALGVDAFATDDPVLALQLRQDSARQG